MQSVQFTSVYRSLTLMAVVLLQLEHRLFPPVSVSLIKKTVVMV